MRLTGTNIILRTYAPAFLYAITAVGFVVISTMPANWIGNTLGIQLFTHVNFLTPIIFAIVFIALLKNHAHQSLIPSLFIAAGALGVSIFINILPQLSLTFALVGVFGFVGLVPKWRQWWSTSVFAALLIALVLPFGVSSQTGFGFFMRVAVTDAAAQILNLFGMTLLSAHDVLIFENSLARVDAPCSGLKSLFTGTAYFLAASAVLQRRMTFKWLLAYSAFLFLIVTGNVTRIIILVTMLEAFDAQPLAELLHIPLGIIFFALACAAGTWLLTTVETRLSVIKTNTARQRSPMLGSLISLCAVGVALTFAPPRSYVTITQLSITAPSNGLYKSLPLTPAETRFYNSNPQTNAKKWRFERNNLSGSLLIVRSSALTAMHAPEICFEANGFNVRNMSTHTLTDRETIRELSLDNPPMRAIYWMQSHATVTDSFTTRLGRYAFKGENDWVMITILFDNDPSFTSKMTTDFYTELKQHVDELITAERGISYE
jgi:exosortase O